MIADTRVYKILVPPCADLHIFENPSVVIFEILRNSKF
jgi:hypothetical protein